MRQASYELLDGGPINLVNIPRDATKCLCDLDGTLVQSTAANNCAYFDAVNRVKGLASNFRESTIRVTRANLRSLLPNLTDRDVVEVVRLKETLYDEYLPLLELNHCLLEFCGQYSPSNVTLVSQGLPGRVASVVGHFNLSEVFGGVVSSPPGHQDILRNKYLDLRDEGAVDFGSVVLFEDDLAQLRSARQLGIHPSRCVRVIF